MKLRFAISLIAVLPSFGCGVVSNDGSESLAPLIELIEEGESILERGIPIWRTPLYEFLDCYNKKIVPSGNCEFERVDSKLALESVAEEWDFSALKAELQALRLTDNPEASRARDAFVRHLRAWQDQVTSLLYSMPSGAEVYRLDYTFVEKWIEILEDEAIQTTFDETCSGLGNAQPKSSSEYESRIIDICDD